MTAVAGAGADRTYRLALKCVHLLLGLCTRRTLTGGQHVPPTGPVLVVGNHLSMADSVVLAVALDRCGRRVRMMSTAGVFRVPVLGALLRRAGYVPVYRRSATPAAALGPAAAGLRAGECVGLYP